MTAAARDLHHAWRALRRSPGFAFATAATLALGIGATVATFSVLEGILLRPLPYSHPERIVRIWESSPARGLERFEVLPGSFLDWRERSASFEALALYRTSRVLVTLAGGTEHLQTTFGSPALFRVFGVGPVLGRGFLPEEGRNTDGLAPDTYAGRPEVVISHALWQRRFGGDPGVIGERAVLSGVSSLTIVGVMPPGFDFPAGTEIWGESVFTRGMGRGDRWRDAVGRLRPGTSIAGARAELQTIAAQSAIDHPATNGGWTVAIEPLAEVVVGPARPALLALFAAVACLLLIACANVSSALLARSAARRQELLLRLALGATRGRLVRLALAEGLLIALSAGAIGVLLADVLLSVALAWAPPAIPRLDEVGIGGRVLAFALGLSAATSLVFAFVPFFGLKRVDLENALRGSDRLATSGRPRTRTVLLAAQVALSLALLFGAGLLIQSLAALRSRNLGMDPSGVHVAELALPLGRFAPPGGLRVGGRPEWEQLALFYERLLEHVRNTNGIQSAALVSVPPVAGDSSDFFRHHGAARLPSGDRLPAVVQAITPDYFDVLRVPLREGRAFTRLDRVIDGRRVGAEAAAPGVAIVNETMARRYWPGRDPIGQAIAIEGDSWVSHRTIVGVAADVFRSPSVMEVEPIIYVPLAERRPLFTMTLLARSASDPASVAALAAALRGRDAALSVSAVRPLDEVLGQPLAEHRFGSLLVSAFGIVALFIAAFGLYGAMAFVLSRRIREIGIRIALGARNEDIARLIGGSAARPVLAGLGLGAIMAVWVSRIVASVVPVGTRPEPIPLISAVLLILLAAVLAVAAPIRAAAAVDPIRTLRSD